MSIFNSINRTVKNIFVGSHKGEVIKDEDGIHLTDNETGAEYYIKESEEVYEDGVLISEKEWKEDGTIK